MTDPAPAFIQEAAPAWRRVLAAARFDTRVMLSNGEQVLLTLILPILLLLGLTLTHIIRLNTDSRINLVAPGVLALAVMSTAFTGQAISTAFDRRNGVLRLLATTPLGRGGFLAGRILAVLCVQAIQLIVLVPISLALGWEPRPAGIPAALLMLLLGTSAFVALGLLLAGTLRPEAVLAAANLLWVLLVAVGGLIIPVANMGWMHVIPESLPSGALGGGLRAALSQGQVALAPLVVLAVWTLLATLAVRRWFRWND